jgi:hypothetical protein
VEPDDITVETRRIGRELPCAAELAWILRKLFAKFGNIFAGRSPVRVACITVKHQRTGLQHFFEFLPAEGNCLVVIVRTHNLEIHAVAHKPPAICEVSDLSRCPVDALTRAANDQSSSSLDHSGQI